MSEEPKTTTAAPANKDLDAAVERARRFEAEAEDAKRKLEAFKGIDLEEVKTLRQSYNDLMRERANKGGDKEREEWEATLKADYDKRYGSKYTELETQLNAKSKEVERLAVVNPAMLHAAQVFNDKELALVQMLVEKELAYHNGEVIVKDENGKPRPSKLDPRKNMDIAEYMAELADKYPGIAKPKTQAGAKNLAHKANTTTNGETKITVQDYLAMEPAERARLPINVRGPLATQALKERKV